MKPLSSIKNNPIGFFGGGFVAYSFFKNSTLPSRLMFTLIGGIVGTIVEHKIRSKASFEKMKGEIKNAK